MDTITFGVGVRKVSWPNAYGDSENTVLVAGRFCTADAADDLEVRLPFEEALPDSTGDAITLDAGPALDKRLQQLAAAGAAHTERIGEHRFADGCRRRRYRIQRGANRRRLSETRRLKLGLVFGDVDQIEVQLRALAVEDAQ